MDNDASGGAPPPVTDQIDANLRRVYREIVGDAVPDRFTKLLEELRRQDSVAAAEPAKGASVRRAAGETS